MGRLYFITGGAGSGKSEYAEQLAERLHAELAGPLYYVATMNPTPRDSDAAARIAKHQKRRENKGYTTIECPTDIAQLHALLKQEPPVATECPTDIAQLGRLPAHPRAVFLLEDLTNLYANEVYGTSGHPHAIVAPLLQLVAQAGAVIVVANELYSDGIDYGEETNRFLRNIAGIAAQLSAAADQVTEVVYGIPVQLKV